MATFETTAFFNEQGTLITNDLPGLSNRKVKLIIQLNDGQPTGIDDIDIAALSKLYAADEPDYQDTTLNEPGIEYDTINEGEIVLVELPQSVGAIKLRPALVLKRLPTYDDFLVCGISTQHHRYIENFDEMADEGSPMFPFTGL